MEAKRYIRKHKEEKPVLAICYDFDKTLSYTDMQAQGYIQSLGLKVEEFWKSSNQLAEDNDMDQNLAYMYMMREEAIGNLLFKKEKLQEYGSAVELFPGVETWFERIRDYGLKHGVIVEHYIISSGLKEMIEGTKVAQENAFEKIYASSFYYDHHGLAVWPAQVVNYTNKTQFLFRIEKGVLDVNDPGVNDYFDPEDIRVPFRNMVYIGDSDTDIPCMKLVNTYGGHSIGVYNPETCDKKKVYKMMQDNGIKYFVPADYSDGKELDALLKAIIKRTAANEKLEKYYSDLKEEVQNTKISLQDKETKQKEDLILALENSSNFARTHTIIEELSEFDNWSNEQIIALARIGINNHQVYWILRDNDIARFYMDLLKNTDVSNDDTQRIQKLLKIE